MRQLGKMNNKSYIGIIILFVVFLSSCTSTYMFDYDELSKEVAKIEIIQFSEYEGSLYPDQEKSYVVLLTLVNEQKDNFIQEFALLEYKRFSGSPNNRPQGICLKFYYFDETYAFITNYTYLHFNQDGDSYQSTLNIHTDEGSFMDLINRYTNS